MSNSPDGLFIFVEGTDDERFFRSVVQPKLCQRYAWVKLQTYAQTTPSKTEGLLRNIPNIDAEYIFVADNDDCPSTDVRKEKLRRKLTLLEHERIVVVVKEIESWYLAGLDSSSASSLQLPNLSSTGSVDKARFDNLTPSKFESKIDFMAEVLKHYSVEIAKEKNESFRDFWNQHCE